MAVTIKLSGSEVENAIKSLRLFPRKLQTKQVRIAMNAAMAPIKALVVTNAPKDTGLLKKSIRIKVKVPDASWNPKHWGKPAYGIVGPGRGVIGVRSFRKGGVLGVIGARTVAAAEKLTKSGKGKVVTVKETQRFKGSPGFGQIIVKPKRASRYAHFTEKGRKGKGGTGYMAKAATQGAAAAMEAFVRKLTPGIYAEAANIYAG